MLTWPSPLQIPLLQVSPVEMASKLEEHFAIIARGRLIEGAVHGKFWVLSDEHIDRRAYPYVRWEF